jgi:hypothetical protein
MHRQPTLLFLHIPKTAGTSVSLALVRRFSAHELYHVRDPKHAQAPCFSPHHGPQQAFGRLSTRRKQKFRCVLGHFHFGLHETLPGPAEYFTLLRDPLQRYVSQVAQYNRMQAAGELGSDTRPVSLMEFRALKPRQFENPQTRWISGLTANQIADRSPADVLQLAQHHLDTHFRAVGVVERMDESMAVLASRSGWSCLSAAKANASAQRPSVDQLTADQYQRFMDSNRLDRELWQFANRRLDAELATAATSHGTSMGGSSKEPWASRVTAWWFRRRAA